MINYKSVKDLHLGIPIRCNDTPENFSDTMNMKHYNVWIFQGQSYLEQLLEEIEQS